MKSKFLPFYAVAILALLATLGLASSNPRKTRLNTKIDQRAGATVRPLSSSSPKNSSLSKPSAGTMAALRQLRFEPNLGQLDSQYQFIGHGADYLMFLNSSGATFALPKSGQERAALRSAGKHHHVTPADRDPDKPAPIEYSEVRMKLRGGSSKAFFEPIGKLPGKVNYFIGKDPGRWHRNIPIYSRLEVHNVYPDIDLVYHPETSSGDSSGQLEYDLVVAPGGDPDVIDISFEGVDSMTLDARGDLQLKVAGRVFTQRAPLVYQDSGNARRIVAAHYRLRGKHDTSIQLASYDREKPIVIDPQLVWATYLGGTQNDAVDDVATRPNNGSDNVYVTGTTASMDLSVKASPTLNQLVGGDDAFVAELSHDGATIIYFSYLGGSNQDLGNGIAVDPSGNAYVVGRTFSSNFPTTVGAKDTSCCDGWSGAFVSKLLSDGSNLAYSTFIRGRPDMSGSENGRNSGNAIAVDPMGNAYVTGWTDSLNFPTKSGDPNKPVFQGSNGGILAGRDCSQGGCINGFVTEVNQDGSDYVFSTYLGGETFTRGLGIDVQGTRPMPTAPEVYTPFVTGETTDLMFPVTPNAFQTTLGNGTGLGENAFVTELKSDATGLTYSTYLGDGSELGNEVAAIAVTLDTTFPDRKMVCVTGETDSPNFPTCDSPGVTCSRASHAFQGAIFPQELEAVYVTCFDFDGNTIPATGTRTGLAFSTFIHSTMPEGSQSAGSSIKIDDCDNVYVAGSTDALHFPVTTNAPFQQIASKNGTPDAFVTALDFLGSPPDCATQDTAFVPCSPIFSTYLGGSNSDAATGLALDLNDNILVGGGTSSGDAGTDDFPTTAGSAQRNFGGGGDDGFVAKIATIPGACMVDNCSVAVTVTKPGNAQGTPGQTVPAGSVTLTNSCADAIFVSDVQLTLSDPGIFSSLNVKSTVKSNMSMSSASASPSGITKFTFPQLVQLVPGDFTTIDVSATIAHSPDGNSSSQVVFGSEQFDERGHVVVNSGIPAAFGTITQSAGATPTATATSAATLTTTPTFSATPTVTATAQQTATRTASPTTTASGTIVATPTATSTGTGMPTQTATATPIAVLKPRVTAPKFPITRVGRSSVIRLTVVNKNKFHLPLTFGNPAASVSNQQPPPPPLVIGFPGSQSGISPGNCPQSLPANKSCFFNLVFVPVSKNTTYTSTVTVFDNGGIGAQSANLKGVSAKR